MNKRYAIIEVDPHSFSKQYPGRCLHHKQYAKDRHTVGKNHVITCTHAYLNFALKCNHISNKHNPSDINKHALFAIANITLKLNKYAVRKEGSPSLFVLTCQIQN